MQRYGISRIWKGEEEREKRKPKGNKNDDRKVGWGHESRGCHKIQLLSSLVTFSTSYKITLSWSHTESLKLYFCYGNQNELRV